MGIGYVQGREYRLRGFGLERGGSLDDGLILVGDIDVGEEGEGGGSRGRGSDAERESDAALVVVLGDGHIGDAGVVPGEEFDGTPDAGGDEAWPPVPAEVAGFFADIALPGKIQVGRGRWA